MRRILVFDNYDSFTWNLVQVLGRVTDAAIEVHRNDNLPLEAVEAFDAVVLSPGPGIPEEAGQLLPLIRRYAARKPLLGVCLGHQAIGEAFGAKLLNMAEVFHGVATPVHPAVPDALFAGLSRPFAAGRYHSWTIDPETVPAELEVTARDAAGHIMAIRHRTFPVCGVQFHPESVLTPEGEQLLRNWVVSWFGDALSLPLCGTASGCSP